MISRPLIILRTIIVTLGIFYYSSSSLPVVDKGVFVIVGVSSCRNGSGYCILGSECSVDKEFTADDAGGHCDGLKTAFTPRANFICCMLLNPDPTTTPVPTTTAASTTAQTVDKLSAEEVSVESNSEESLENSGQVSVEMTTTSTIYEEKTEINLEQSLSMEVICGTHYGAGEGRVASNSESGESSCFTAALVRSPTSLFSLSDPGSFLCTGAMISKEYLLTSATCVSRLFQQDLNLFKVILGARHIIHPSHGLSPTADYRGIEEIRVHENYTIQGHLRFSDIALVKLETKNTSSNYCSICLPDQNQDWNGVECLVNGYSHPPDSNDSDGFLHEALQHVESKEHCESTSGMGIPNTNLTGLICGSGEKSAEACFSPRDAGSPLSCKIGGINKLGGIFSSGFHCGSRESPVLYTDVRKYLNWIRGVL